MGAWEGAGAGSLRMEKPTAGMEGRLCELRTRVTARHRGGDHRHMVAERISEGWARMTPREEDGKGRKESISRWKGWQRVKCHGEVRDSARAKAGRAGLGT